MACWVTSRKLAVDLKTDPQDFSIDATSSLRTNMARTKITKRGTTKKSTASTKTVTGGRAEEQGSDRSQYTSSSSGSDEDKRRNRAAKRTHSDSETKNKEGSTRKRLMTSSESESPNSTSPKTAAKRSQPKRPLSAVEYRKRKITAAAMKKWKPISSETKLMTWNTMDAAVTSVLSSIKPGRRGFNEVQDHLNILRDRIYERVSTAKAPAKKVDYSAIHAKRKRIQEDLKMQEEQLAVLEAEIKRLERGVSKKEKKVDRLKVAAETCTEMELHPILENLPAPCLNLPPLTTGNQLNRQATTGSTPAELLQSILNRD
ncbi:centromere protein Q-like [Branchiostoma lanceolatum]|uniref:centromere protein Q-like n=1 Tax=Branchiostoma lanceolatum TaxID=7740 RepID=UPI0034519E84